MQILSSVCRLSPHELTHLVPGEHEPLDQLAERLASCRERARTAGEERKYAQQQETLRELAKDRSLSPEARASVVRGWWSTPAPGYWLGKWEELTGTPPEQRDALYRQAESLLSMVPARMREALRSLPRERSSHVCQKLLRSAPPAEASAGELAAAAHAAHCLEGVSFQAHGARMLKGLFEADMPAPLRQRAFELVGDRLHALRVGGAESYVSQVSSLLDRPSLAAPVRLAVLEQLRPDLNVADAVEAATVAFSAVAPATSVLESSGFVAFNGIKVRKRQA